MRTVLWLVKNICIFHTRFSELLVGTPSNLVQWQIFSELQEEEKKQEERVKSADIAPEIEIHSFGAYRPVNRHTCTWWIIECTRIYCRLIALKRTQGLRKCEGVLHKLEKITHFRHTKLSDLFSALFYNFLQSRLLLKVKSTKGNCLLNFICATITLRQSQICSSRPQC